MDNLPELRDIHLPPETSMFPPAYGWYVLAAAILALWLAAKYGRYIRQKSKKLYALRLLKAADADNLDSARKISEILRRICRFKYAEAVFLSGAAWIEFLNRHCSLSLKDKAAELLAHAPYIPDGEAYTAQDYAQLRRFAQQWIGENL